jgi:exopolyphosphatase / guanosine-5'-triphosphate,3'-diphosphate pyrophosphatase
MAYFRGSSGERRSRDDKPAGRPPKREQGKAAPQSSGSAAPKANGRAQYPARRAYAALDLGTNNCRMLIARPDGDGFAIVDAFSRIVRLGEGLAASGRLSDAAMDRAVSALSVCASKLARRNVHLSRAVATEACRRASNGQEFVDRVARETGIILDIIAPEEEAKLAVMGCHRLLPQGDGPALIFDIGGGSTELALVDTADQEPHTLDWVSVPWGVVSLSESVPQDGQDEDARMNHYGDMKDIVGKALSGFFARLPKGQGTRLLGTSGTVTTLASVFLNLPSYDRKRVDGLSAPVMAMRDISRDLARKSVADRAQVACIGHERADLVVAGCAILEAIFDAWPADHVGVADRGIREGILRQLFRLDMKR